MEKEREGKKIEGGKQTKKKNERVGNDILEGSSGRAGVYKCRIVL